VRLKWIDRSNEFIARRYDRIAGLITLLEWLFFLPAKLREKSVRIMQLRPGDRVLEVGCGTGRNFAFLRRAVGPTGHLYGVDLSAGMLARARALCVKQGWRNVTLTHGDIASYQAPAPLDAVLFSLSYNTMPQAAQVLQHIVAQLRPGAPITIMDAKLPKGWLGRMVLPLAIRLNELTVLGNPYIRPWEQLARIVDNFKMEEQRFGSYYICQGNKPHRKSPALTLKNDRKKNAEDAVRMQRRCARGNDRRAR